LLFAASLAVSVGAAHAQEAVRIGQLYDATGPVAAQSTPYAKGGQAAVRWANASGAINGKRIELLSEDYGYQIPRAIAIYRKLRAAGVVAVQGFGSGDTEALIDSVTGDKLPWFSASYSAHLTDGKKAPYNYMVGCDYSCQARAALIHMSGTWKGRAVPAKLAIIYMDNAFGKGILAPVESLAKELNIQIVAREIVNPGALDAVPQMSRVKAAAPDFVLLQQIVSTASAVLRDSAKVGLQTQFYGTVWTWDANLPKLAGKSADGLITVQLSALSSVKLKAEEAMRKHADEPALADDPSFIRGWASMIVLIDAMRAADKGGKLSGESIKAALDSGVSFETGGATPPVRFAAADHRSTDTVFLYRVEAGKPIFMTPMTVERRPEWLGN